MDINSIWSIVEPYVTGVATALGSGSIIYIIVRQLVSKWFKRNDLDTLSQRFAERVVGQDICVDVTALVDKRIDELNATISASVKNTLNANSDTIAKLSAIVADVGDVFARSKTITADEKAKLSADVLAIRGETKAEIKQSTAPAISVKLNASKTEKKIINFD